jgi:acetyl-CoA acetyltransferase
VARRVFITGAAESPLGLVGDESELSMVAVAARSALAQAGLRLDEVDGLFVNYMGEEGSVQVGEYLGVRPRYADSSDLGGAAFVAFLHHAFLAVSTGRCEVALVAYASRQRSRRSRGFSRPEPPYALHAQFESPYGLPLPVGAYALIAARHMHEFGTTPEQLAEVAVSARRWAQLNPVAWSRGELSIADVLASPPISEPLHRLDCCLVTDGGGAVVVTSAGAAASCSHPLVEITGVGESHGHWNISQMADLTVTDGVRSGREAFAMAGLGPADIDFVEPYDSFTITPILAFEDLGFCAKGEGGAFVSGGRLAPGGALPAMTSGGGLSYCHPGALGLLLVIEAVRQLRGEAGARQVPRHEVGLVHGVGGFCSTAATAVLIRA